MKLLNAIALLFGATLINDTQAAEKKADSGKGKGAKTGPSKYCMKCKLMDSTASFLYSYSYCADTDTCLKDAWNFPNQWCKTGWVPGFQLDLDVDCRAEDDEAGCPSFSSTPDILGKEPEYYQRMLRAGKKCTLTIDASDAPARFTISKRGDNSITYDGDFWQSKSLEIGVLRAGYRIGDSILVPEGTKEDVTIYNGDSSKAIQYLVTYSGATKIASSLILTMGALSLY